MQGTDHFAALLRTFLTGVRTAPAMVVIVLATFTCALLAHPGAQRTQLAHETLAVLIGTRHPRSGHAADVRAITIQLYAARHHLHILLVQARGGAMFTLLGALFTRLNAALIFLMHDGSICCSGHNHHSGSKGMIGSSGRAPAVLIGARCPQKLWPWRGRAIRCSPPSFVGAGCRSYRSRAGACLSIRSLPKHRSMIGEHP